MHSAQAKILGNRKIISNEDEFATYGEHVANQLRKLKKDKRSLCVAMFEIDKILYDAVMKDCAKRASMDKIEI